jgi:hypothetical protein
MSGAVALAVLASAGAAAASGAAGSAPRALLDEFVCQKALDPGQRSVSVRAVMRPLKNTHRMSLRFVLLSRADGGPFTQVHGGILGTWQFPTDPPTLGTRPGDIWRLSSPVVDLPAPAIYRFQVEFRWIGAHGRVIGTQVRTSRNCFQPELRPDLAAVSFDAQPVAGHPKKDAYTAVIADEGATGAGPFQVQFTFGTVVKDHTVTHIRAHQELAFNFQGPVCDSTAPPTMTIDPDQQVDDYNRSNNSITATCPAPTPTS